MTPQRQTENDKNLAFNNHLKKFETLHFVAAFAYILNIAVYIIFIRAIIIIAFVDGLTFNR